MGMLNWNLLQTVEVYLIIPYFKFLRETVFEKPSFDRDDSALLRDLLFTFVVKNLLLNGYFEHLITYNLFEIFSLQFDLPTFPTGVKR